MKLLLLTLAADEENMIDKIIAALSEYINPDNVHPISSSVLSFPGLEIRKQQHLVFLASNPGIVLTREQIFEAVWNMESDSCHSSVGNVIYNLRKKIEPDS